ncbi:MAG: DUF503 domain-containing protein [Dehalococcoidia bacterium]
MMNVGACLITLRLPENDSLKGKRQVIKSLVTRLHGRYNVSVAEVGNNESWQIASLGVTCVSNSSRHANEVISKVVAFIEHSRLNAEVLDYEVELLQAF